MCNERNHREGSIRDREVNEDMLEKLVMTIIVM